MMAHDRMLPIAIFYDGTYFQHVSNYYAYDHPLRRRISIEGLHKFVQREVAKLEGVEGRYARVVEAHYFRGRLAAGEAQDRDILYGERVFEDILMRAGVATHYLPLSSQQVGGGEKGVDVWLALEAYELAQDKKFGVSVLLTGDGDYVPLIRKLNSLGTRVMVMGWDLERAGVVEPGHRGTPRIARSLLQEATYPIEMASLIEQMVEDNKNNPEAKTKAYQDLFVPNYNAPPHTTDDEAHKTAELDPPNLSTKNTGPLNDHPNSPNPNSKNPDETGDKREDPGGEQSHALEEGLVVNINDNGYGFIAPHGDSGNDRSNLFFFRSELENCHFNDLQLYTTVLFRRSENERGPCAVDITCL